MAEKPDVELCVDEKDISEDDDDEVDSETPSPVVIPSPRFWHFSQLFNSNVYIGGGNIPKYNKTRSRSHLATIIEKFDVRNKIWQQRETTGDHHPGLTGVACASFGKYLFAYGGNDAKDLNGVLSQLDLDTFIWSQLSPETADGPMKKDASGMVHFGEDKLVVVCGYAEPKRTFVEKSLLSKSLKSTGGSSDTKSVFIQRSPEPTRDKGGWTNEIHIFNINERSWWSPDFIGQRPPPCADFTITSIDSFRAILYSGNQGKNNNLDSKTSPLYLFDFQNMHITIPEIKGDKLPPLRLGQHVACCLGLSADNPHLLVSGGRLSVRMQPPLKDMWLLNLTSWTWQEVELPNDYARSHLLRWGYTATTVTHYPEGFEEVIVFGGSHDYYDIPWDTKKDYHRWADLTSFKFDQKMMLVDVVFDDASQQKTAMKEKFSLKQGLRGIDVCGETRMIVTNSTQDFEWGKFGLKVRIEEFSLPADIKQMKVNIIASIAGHYESPEDYDRASAVFWFQCEPNIKFEKKITIEIQHCAMSEDVSMMSFARAVCSQEKLPYTFKLLKGGEFMKGSPYGNLSLNKFSGIGAFFKKHTSVKRKYYASLFHLTKQSSHEVHIVVTWNTKSHLNDIRERYNKLNVQLNLGKQILFESNKIELNIPTDGTIVNGWKIIPLKPPEITKEDVDDYRPGRGIPSCVLGARIVDQSTTQSLEHTITLNGAKPANTYFNLFIAPGTLKSRHRLESSTTTVTTSCCSSDLDSSVLVPQLPELLKELQPTVADRWKDIGIMLRIPIGRLDIIQADNSSDCSSCMREMLRHYLQQVTPLPSWGAVIAALKSLKLDHVAKHIRSEYLQSV